MARKQPIQQVNRTASRPSPIGGLNVRDALTNMPPTDCVVATNWIPYPYGSRVRKGWREWATTMTNPVQTILTYMGATTTAAVGVTPSAPTSVTGKMFACTKSNVYDISTSTNAPSSVKSLSGSTYAGYVSQSMVTNIAGSYMVCASEVDGYFYYDGASWTVPTFGGGAGQVGGVNPANVSFVFVYKRRVWFIERNTSNLWYLPVDQITGTAVKFEVGPFLKNGGPVAQIANWTIDAGTGIDDMFVIVSEQGDVLVYKGTDPASASTFSIVGSWEVGEVPKGHRCLLQYGGDLIILSNDGLFPMSHVTRGGAQMLQATEQDYTSKIQELIAGNLANSFNLYGWQMQLYQRDSLLIISVPDHSSIENRQFVMNTAKNEWCLFSDIPVNCMNQTSGYLFAGTSDGRVIIMQDGYFDEVAYGATVGNGIVGEIQPAFDYFEKLGANKNFLMVRPTFLSVDKPGVTVQMNVDFTFTGSSGTPVIPPASGSLWDVSLWDVATWAGAVQTYQQWIGVNGMGFAGSLNLKTLTAGDTQLASIDYMMEDGGPL